MPCFAPIPKRWRASVLLSVAVLLGSAGAAADELSDVQKLNAAGQTDAAMARVESFLAVRPTDPQMRFMKGVMLAAAGRNAEATVVFEKLTEDHPDLVEPYNNLAALYAAAGDYPKARSTLEQALRANPAYAIAYENLGDVYIALAGQSYGRALQLAPTDRSLAPRLALVRQVLASKVDASGRPGVDLIGGAAPSLPEKPQ